MGERKLSRGFSVLRLSNRFPITTSFGVAFIILGYYYILWPSFRHFLLAIDFSDIPFADFAVYYYEMGKEIFTTKSPAYGYHYSPFFAIVLGLFGMLSLPTATAIWVLLLLTALLALIFLSFRLVSPSEPKFLPLLVALIITSFPVLHDFKWGQVGVLTTVLLLTGLSMFLKKREVLAGVLIASAVSLKYYPAVFLFPFLIGGNKKLLLSFFVTSLLFLLIIPSIVLGTQETLAFVDTLASGAYAKQLAAGGPNSQNIVNVFTRWSSFLDIDRQALRFLVRTIGYLALEATVVLIFLLYRRSIPRAPEWAFLFLFLSVPLFVATSWPHYLVYFPFCQFFLFREIRSRETYSARHRRLLLLLLSVSAFLSSVFALNVMGHWEAYTGGGFLFLSDLIMLGLAYRLVLPVLARGEPRWRGISAAPYPH